jgi:23S rRNA (guanosine2251-2'-O)-methyltransferase
MKDIVLVLDNIRSLYNVGSMFRTADGFGVSRIFLCGITGTPEQNGLKKVSLGAEDSVAWEHHAVTWRVLEGLRAKGYRIVGLETGPSATDVRDARSTGNIALVVGNEVRGLTPALRKRLDAMIEIPMLGMKRSFNVGVACGVALYALRYGAEPVRE